MEITFDKILTLIMLCVACIIVIKFLFPERDE